MALFSEWSEEIKGGNTSAEHFSTQGVRKRSTPFAQCPLCVSNTIRLINYLRQIVSDREVLTVSTIFVGSDWVVTEKCQSNQRGYPEYERGPGESKLSGNPSILFSGSLPHANPILNINVVSIGRGGFKSHTLQLGERNPGL